MAINSVVTEVKVKKVKTVTLFVFDLRARKKVRIFDIELRRVCQRSVCVKKLNHFDLA